MTEQKLNDIPAGTVVMISRGTYSDYCVVGIAKAVKHVPAQALLDQWLSDHPEQRQRYEFNASGFLSWIAGQGYFEETGYTEFHLGDYGISEETFTQEQTSILSREGVGVQK